MGFNSGRLSPRRDLPGSHYTTWELDLAKNQKAAIVLNVAALPLFALFGWIFVKLASFIRPEIMSRLYLTPVTAHPIVFFLIFLVVVVGIMFIHEAIHGAFFWMFTRSKPIFGLKLLFAYAGAPEWYIPRNQYAAIGLAPLLLITIAGFLVIFLAPLSVGQLALFGITMNASGAVGDLYVSGKVMCQSRDVLIQDTGVGFTMFSQLDTADETPERNSEGGVNHEQ
jgi:hypothetical protein